MKLDASTVPTGLAPTKVTQGDDRAVDSSRGESVSVLPLLENAAEDMPLDFGFWPTTPGIQIVKTDADGNDADTADDAVFLPNGSTKLVFTVTNTGDEDLKDIKVSDKVVKEGKVTNLSCTFPDKSTGTTWAGPFVVGDTFSCTAQLSGVKKLHEDVATVEGNGVDSNTPVTDDNPYHAGGAVAFPPENPEDNENEAAPAKNSDVLPATGAPSGMKQAGLVGLMLLAGGAALLLAGKRRKA